MKRITERGIYAGSKTVFLHDNVEKAVRKLAKYEDEEEQGLLIHLPGEVVYHIVDQHTSYGPMVMATKISGLKISEIWGIDKSGEYWSTRKKAEKKLQEMMGL